jgi:hypothetical protein
VHFGPDVTEAFLNRNNLSKLQYNFACGGMGVV